VKYKSDGRHWVFDSGCTQHMTKNGRMFTSIDNEGLECDKITISDNSKGNMKGLGKIAISNDLSILNVLLVEYLSYNLLSVAQLCDFGLICKFSPKDVVITSIKSDELIFKGFCYGNLYLIDFNSNDASLSTCLFTKSSKGWLWHRILAHVGINQLKKLMKHDLIIVLNNDIIFEKNKLCSVCQAGKQVENTHLTKSVMSTLMSFELLHMNLFVPTTYRSIGGNSYGLVVDDYSRYTWVLVTNQMCSLYSRVLLRELKMNLISKSRRLEVIMTLSSRPLELKIIVMKREPNMNFQTIILRNKIELLKGTIGL
jgi:hypothetical protein